MEFVSRGASVDASEGADVSAFRARLRERNPDPGERRWLFVAPDQLSDSVGPLADEDPATLGIVLVETPWKARRRPYHKQKLALVLANLRWFALEQAERGVAVRHLVGDGPYRDALRPVAEELGPLQVQEPAERELRADLAPLFAEGLLEEVPHAGFLTSRRQFEKSQGKKAPPWRMDRFYRAVRKAAGYLLDERGKPLGGKWSHDASNREAWSGDPPAPEPPRFPCDPIKDEVCALVEELFGGHPGRLDPDSLPATRADAEAAWSWAKERCLRDFGPYEDAMSSASRTLFHTRISPLLNLGRLDARRLIEEALARKDTPLSSREGFLRQILGWREFVRHVHHATDGFRCLPGEDAPPTRKLPGDGGFGAWRGEDFAPAPAPDGVDGGAAPSRLGADRPVPAAFWGAASGLRCLDTVVASVWEEAYSHHITRLMVLGNLATLLDISPRALTDWFWVAYQDAYDWVVEPNVLGMGTFAVGPLMTTKPYVSGAAYIHKMSDYCGGCAFDPKKTCPITRLYWQFLWRHRETLAGNPRIALQLGSAKKRAAARRKVDRQTFERVWDALAAGAVLRPEDLPEERK